MSSILHVTEIDLETYEHRRYFSFPLDPNPRGGMDYRSRTSVNAFAWGMHHRNYRPNKARATHLYLVRRESEIFDPVELAHMQAKGLSLDSIWSFYQAVGYDYKRKSWSVNFEPVPDVDVGDAFPLFEP